MLKDMKCCKAGHCKDFEAMPMIEKDYQPIEFEFFQKDIEKLLYALKTCKELVVEDIVLVKKIQYQIDEIQHKVDYHKSEGEWKE